MRFAPGFMAAGLLIAASTLASAQDPSRRASPDDVNAVEPGLHDLGFVLAGTRIGAEVTVENPFDADIRYLGLDDAHPSVEVILSPATIGAHGTAKVALRLDAAEFVKSPTVVIGLLFEGKTGRTHLAVPLRATLESVFACSPAALDLGGAQVGQTRSAQLVVLPVSKEEAEFTEIVAPAELRVTRTLGRIIEGRLATIFDVELAAPPRLGAYDAQIRMKLRDSGRIEWLPIPVHAEVQSDVVVEPRTLALGRLVRGRDGLGAELDVKALGDRPVSVVRCDCTGPLLASVSGGRIQVAVKADAEAGPVSGSVRVYVDRQWEPIVTVPVEGEIREPYLAVPAAVFLDGGAGGLASSGATVELHAEPGFPLEIAGFESDLQFIEAVAATQAGRTSIVVRLKPGSTPPAMFSGVLRILTRSTVAPEIDLPVTGRSLGSDSRISVERNASQGLEQVGARSR